MAEAATSGQPLPILIAGGGIAGLSAALALAQAGLPSRLLERRAAFSESGAGIQLGPNAVKVLRRLGALGALLPHAGRPRAIVVRDGRSGRELQSLPLGDWIEARHGAPYLVAHRGDLQNALLAQVRQHSQISVETGFDVVAADTAQSVISVRATDGRTLQGHALVAADGVHSVLRRAWFPDALPGYTGRMAARTVIPTDALTGAAKDVLAKDATGVWLAPDAHVVHYPVRGGREIAVVVITTGPEPEVTRGGSDAASAAPDASWSIPATREAILQSITQFAPALREALGVATDWRKWALLDAEPLPSWSQGRGVLIGDAAHPVLPFLAQGGGLALEDAAVLAHHVARAPHDLPRVFRDLHAARAARTARVLAGARGNGRAFHMRGVEARVRNTVLRLSPPARVMAGYDWLYGWEPPALG